MDDFPAYLTIDWWLLAAAAAGVWMVPWSLAGAVGRIGKNKQSLARIRDEATFLSKQMGALVFWLGLASFAFGLVRYPELGPALTGAGIAAIGGLGVLLGRLLKGRPAPT